MLAVSVTSYLIPGMNCKITTNLGIQAKAAKGSLPSCTIPARICGSAGEMLSL